MDTGLVIASDVQWAFQANSGAPATAQVVTSLTAADRPEPVMWNTAENDLLTRVAGGDIDAFSEMYDRFAGAMFSLAMQILRDGAAAEDVVQDAFVQIWEKASTYNPSLGKPMTWAVTLVRNRAIDRLRSVVRRQKLAESVAQESGPGEPLLPGADGQITRADAQSVRPRIAAAARLPSYSTLKIQPTVSCPTRPLLWAATTLPPIRS